MSTKVWLDADSCPVAVRDFVVKYAHNFSIKVVFVANKPISACFNDFEMIVCNTEKDAADNYILKHASQEDLVITKDVIFASKLIEKSITTINDRGTLFTKNNISEKLSDRDFDFQLAQIGLGGKKGSFYSKKEFLKFKECFNKEMQRLLKNATSN